MPPKKDHKPPNPWYCSTEDEGLAVAARVCRYADDIDERDELLAMLGLESLGELRVRLMRREADRLCEDDQKPPVFNHYPMRSL